MKATRRVQPAHGEGWAVGGYDFQHRVTALLILRGLRDGSLGWIRIKDVAAGRVDDFVLGSDDRVDGYQVKRRAQPLSYRDFTRGSVEGDGTSGNDSLIRQLAGGWQLLRRSHGPRAIVHLVTNARASAHDRIASATREDGPRSFTAFLQEMWLPAHDAPPGTQFNVPAKWERTWEELRQASRLTPEEFTAFVRDCQLELEFDQLPAETGTETRDHEQLLRDIDQIRHEVFDLAATLDAPIELDHGQLVTRLGWRQRFEPRNPHDFPVDEALYQPISASVEDLTVRLDGVTRGYIGVFGSPGSGKSSLLTHALRYRPERVIRYYAYVPDAQNPWFERGEADAFLHDLVLALEREGFKTGEGLVFRHA